MGFKSAFKVLILDLKSYVVPHAITLVALNYTARI